MSRRSHPVALLIALSAAALSSVAAPATVRAAADSAAENRARRDCERLNDAGSYVDALPHCRAAVALLDGTTPGHRPTAATGELGQALTSLGLALEMTGERQAAESSYRQALALHRSLGQHEREALVLSNLAALAIGGGDYGAALAWLATEEAVAEHALAAGDASWATAEQNYVRMNRSVAYEQLGAYGEALGEIRPLSKGQEPGNFGGERDRAALAVNLAVLYRNLGDPRRALTLLDEARLTYEHLEDRSALANVHLNRGLVYELNLRAPANAEAELAEALVLARASGDRGEELRTLCALGDLRLSSGRVAEARGAFESALGVAVASDAAAGRWTAEAGLGRVARDAGDPDSALLHLRAAIAEIERAGAGVGSSALRGGLLSDQRAVYATAVDLLANRAVAGRPDSEGAALAALALAEQAKARELLDALAGGGSATPLDAAALAALAPRLGSTLAYFFGDRALWRWELRDGHWRVAAAGPAAEIAPLVARIHRRLARSLAADPADLARLGGRLLPATLAPGPELRIVPDGRLFYLPFDLLPDPERPAATLLDRLAVSYLPSLSVFAHLREGAPGARWRFAALAAPALPAASPGGSLAGLLARRFGLPPLPAAEREARDAARRLGGATAVDVGSAATESRLRERAAEGARVLHVAAHTVVDESVAGGVALFLAPGPAGPGGETSAPDDGLVSAAELAQLPLTCDLAVLSGCRTALAADDSASGDRAGGGRSLASLSGALLGAGARGVVASLWEVGDAGTAALMEQFYFELARGSRPALALRAAKLRLAHDPRWAKAPGWAGFVLLGDPEAVVPARSAGWELAGALALLAVGLVFLLFDSRRRRAGRDEAVVLQP